MIRAIVKIALKPGVELRQLATEALSKIPDPDPLRAFSLVCRADLDKVRKTMELRRGCRAPDSVKCRVPLNLARAFIHT